jgi:hypothetical protein
VGAFLRLSLPSATGLLAVATIAGVVGLYELHLHTLALIALVPVLIVAAIYLRAYSARPLHVPPRPPSAQTRTATPPPASASVSAPELGTPEAAASTVPPEPEGPIDENEPFEDPVEEADRLGSGTTPAPPAP